MWCHNELSAAARCEGLCVELPAARRKNVAYQRAHHPRRRWDFALIDGRTLISLPLGLQTCHCCCLRRDEVRGEARWALHWGQPLLRNGVIPWSLLKTLLHLDLTKLYWVSWLQRKHVPSPLDEVESWAPREPEPALTKGSDALVTSAKKTVQRQNHLELYG
jgi:hypothetical protein